MRRMIVLVILLSATGQINAAPAPQTEEGPSRIPRIESEVIATPGSAPLPAPCAGADCTPTYRLTPQQLKQLREIEGTAPGRIIPMRPARDTRRRDVRRK